MIVKINSRGKGGSSGPLNYLLGKNRDRYLAKILRGDEKQTADLINSLDFSRKYTSGCLSFTEKDLPDNVKDTIMDSFEKAIFSGLDADQYNCLWVEHRDKGRLELNFLIPNVELLSGKRLQPYYHRADKTRINAWKDIINYEFKLTDPNDPRRARALSYSADLPRDKEKASQLITEGLNRLITEGQIKNREDVIKALEKGGFTVTRETKNSISIKTPNSTKPLRLKGSIYERDFKFSQAIQGTIEQKIRDYQENSESRILEAKSTYHKASQIKREHNQRRYKRPSTKDMSLISSDTSQNNLNPDYRNNHRNINISNNHSLSKKVKPNINNMRAIEYDRDRRTIGESIRITTRTIFNAIQRFASAIEQISRRTESNNEQRIQRYITKQKQNRLSKQHQAQHGFDL
jgi:hypothetical protein